MCPPVEEVVVASADDAADLEVHDGIPVEPELGSRIASPCSLNSGARWPGGRLPVELHRGRRPAGRACPRRSRSPACSRWRRTAGRPPPRACPARRPLPGEVGQALAPLGQRVLGEDLGRGALHGLRAVGHQDGVVGEAGVGGQLGAPDRLAQRRPSTWPAWRQREGQGPAVLGRVVARQRIRARCVGRWRRPTGVSQHERERDGLAHGPHARRRAARRRRWWPRRSAPGGTGRP